MPVRMPSMRVLAALTFALLAFFLSVAAHTPAAAPPADALRTTEPFSAAGLLASLAGIFMPHPAQARSQLRSGQPTRAGATEAQDVRPR